MSNDTAEKAIEHDPVRLEYFLWGLVAVAAIGDITTTAIGLDLGLVESNAVVSDVIGSYGVPGMVAMKVAAVAIGLVCRRLLDRDHRLIIPAALSLPWLIATALNVYTLTVIA